MLYFWLEKLSLDSLFSCHLRIAITYFCLLFCLLSSGPASAQRMNIDSALQVLSGSREDTAKVKLLASIAWEVSYHDLQKGLDYAEQSMALARKLKAERLYPYVFHVAGSIYNDMSQHGKALDLFTEALKYIHKYDLIVQEGFVYNSLGNFYNRDNDLRKAISFYLLSAETHRRAGNPEPIYKAYNNLGGAYLKLGKPDSAVYYVTLCKKHNLERGDRQSLIYNNIALSEIFTEGRNKSDGLAYADSAVTEARRFADKYTLVRALIQQCYAMKVNRRPEQIVAVVNECLRLAGEIGDLSTQLQATAFAAENYESMGDYRNALICFKQYKKYNDSIVNAENIRQIHMAEARYDNDKKQTQIELLAEKQKLSETRQEKNKLYLYFAVVGLAALSVVIVLLYRNNRNEQKANAELAHYNKEVRQQKELVEEKNKEITDSINYARRIQQSLLTSHSYFRRHTKDFFILFQPKDIVSGDFYWALNHEDRFLLMTADCTGHGVPGAMMSMMGINFINEIVSEKKLSRPADILNQLRKEIIKALNPEDSMEEGKDGMDASLCSFDFRNKRLSYAAANNNFYIIRDGVLLPSHVDKMPVGAGHTADSPFNAYEMELQTDDLVITFTDGYADQFGGPDGKKFKYRQFEKLLTTHASLSMDGLRTVLDKTMKDWRGTLEQVDDICIIGIKI